MPLFHSCTFQLGIATQGTCPGAAGLVPGSKLMGFASWQAEGTEPGESPSVLEGAAWGRAGSEPVFEAEDQPAGVSGTRQGDGGCRIVCRHYFLGSCASNRSAVISDLQLRWALVSSIAFRAAVALSSLYRIFLFLSGSLLETNITSHIALTQDSPGDLRLVMKDCRNLLGGFKVTLRKG